MLKIDGKVISGNAKAKDIKRVGLIRASIEPVDCFKFNNVDEEKASRRIRNYSGEEKKGKDLFYNIGLDYCGGN